jgi:ADP-ribose pyrophosphatase
VILAIDEEDHVLLVEQCRVPLSRRCIELPAGLIGDDDDRQGEDANETTGRELVKEPDYSAEQMEVNGEFWSSPGMVSESFSLFKAHSLTKVGEGGGTVSEDIIVHHVPLSGIAKPIDVRMLLLLGSRLLR